MSSSSCIAVWKAFRTVQQSPAPGVPCQPCRSPMLCLHTLPAAPLQAALLQRRPHVLVGTPGRILELCDGGDLDLTDVSYGVLDEADKMLSLGFQPQLQRLRALLMPAA